MQPGTSSADTPAWRTRALFGIFFISGFCGLIYESIWSHYLKLLLGHAAYAQAVVLVVFVGGLAIGAWLAGLFAHRIGRPVLWYAAIEAAVAAMAFAFHGVFEVASEWASASFLPALCAQGGSCSATWLLAAALILPPSILLGTTFPLMSTGVLRLGAAPGAGLSMLYFLNSAGAALGVVASGFLLIPWLGLPGTLLVAGGMNAFVAASAYLVSHAGRGAQQAGKPPVQPAGAGSAGELRLLLGVAALTGLSSFIYEVVWIRMLTLVFGAATHAFELMLAPFILGLALGAWWIRNRIDDSRDALFLLARIQIAMGLLAVATLPLYASLYDAMAWMLQALGRSESGYVLYNVTTGLMAAAVMLPATVCAGMTLPLITAILLRRGFGERQVGQVYGVNTFGAIAGVLVAVQFLMPMLGLKWALALGAALDVALGIALWIAVARRNPSGAVPLALRGPLSMRPAVVATGAAVSLALLASITVLAPLGVDRYASGVFRHGVARIDSRSVLFHADGKTATVTVWETPDGARSLLTNGKSDGQSHPTRKVTTGDDHTMVLMASFAAVHHPTARTAAVIGLGTGTTSSTLLEMPSLERVDTIEIEPKIRDAAQLFRPRSSRVFEDPRSRIIIDDARAHFAKTAARYDIIVSEPSNPWVSGVAGLFTREFYEHAAGHLAPGGHFVQWLHLSEASPEMVASILRAFGLMFPDFKVYATNNWDIVLVARKDGRMPSIDRGALQRMPRMQRELEQLGISSIAQLAAHDIGRSSASLMLADSYGPIPNSDFYPYVDNRAAEDRFRRLSAHALFSLREAPLPVLEVGAGAPWYAGQVHSATRWMPPHVRNMASSWHGLRYLSGQELSPQDMAYLGSWAQDYALVRAWTAQCQFPRSTGGPWVSMVHVASDLIAGLDAAAAGGFWRSVATRCGSKLEPAQRAWIALFAGIGARRAEEVRVAAQQVLALDTQLTAETRTYAVLAGATASAVLFRREEARDLLSRQWKALPPDQQSAGWFRYVWALLGTQPRPAAP